jgi:hypothetical protein
MKNKKTNKQDKIQDMQFLANQLITNKLVEDLHLASLYQTT